MVAIGGGSGAGKSAVSYELIDNHPEQIEVIQLDDYQFVGNSSRVPVVNGMKNWDHPDAIDWAKLRQDIQSLREGNEIVLQTWAHRSNPGFHIHHQRKSRTITPHPIIIVEGYLALYGAIADIYDHTFFLDVDEQVRMERRRQARGGLDNLAGDPRYREQVLLPMHQQFVEPTRMNAETVIDVRDKTALQVAQLIFQRLQIAR